MHDTIFANRGNLGAIRCPGKGIDWTNMAVIGGDGSQLSIRVIMRDNDGAIFACRCQVRAIERPARSMNCTPMDISICELQIGCANYNVTVSHADSYNFALRRPGSRLREI